MPYQKDDGWILVCSGGRRERLHEGTDEAPCNFTRGNNSWDRRGRGFGWKANASPVSRVDGEQGKPFFPNPKPNSISLILNSTTRGMCKRTAISHFVKFLEKVELFFSSYS